MVTIFVTIAFCSSIAQSEVIFTGRIVDNDSGAGVSNIPVQITGFGEARTQDDGLFKIAIPDGLSQVEVGLPEEWSIIYPVQGRVAVPRDASFTTEIIVKEKFSRLDQLKREVARLRQEKKLSEFQIDSLEQVVKDSMNFYRARLRTLELDRAAERDSIDARIAILTAKIENSVIERKQEQLIKALCQDLNRYLYRLKDFRDWMFHVEDVFLREGAMDQYNKMLNNYSSSWDSLYVNRMNYIDQVRRYWENNALPRETEEVMGLALEDIHEKIILPANESVNGEIADFVTGKSSRLGAQKRAKKSANGLVVDLKLPISTLERYIENLCDQLSVMN
jgi:hypothetical protein